MAKRVILFLAVFILIIVGFLPLVVMLVRSIMVEGHVSLAAYRELLNTGREWRLLGHSFALSFLTAMFATLVGLPLGILFGRTDMPFRRLFPVLFTFPLLIPPYVTAVSWVSLLGRDGFLSRTLTPDAAKVVSAWLFGLPGCVMVLFSAFLPIIILLTMAYLKTIDPSVEEAGRLVFGWPQVLMKITLPLLLPGILFATLLVFLLTLGEYGVPSFLRYHVFAVESFTQFSAFYDFNAATAAATPLLGVTFFALVLERFFLHEKTLHIEPGPGSKYALVIRLGAMGKWFAALTGLLCLLVVVLPFLVLLLRSLSINVYKEAFLRAGDSLLRSILYAAIGASALTILGFFLGYLVQTRAFRFWRAIDSLTIFLFALSGAVMGIGLISLWNRPITNFVYGTPIIIILGYLARYIVIPHRVTVSILGQIPPSMEEAAKVAGASWLQRVGLVVIPLAKRGLVAGWLISYIFCLRDMGITMLVYPPGHDTFPVRIFTLMANGSPELIAALCVLMAGITLVPLGVGGMLYKLKGISLTRIG